jgi:hypothetical protein
MVTLVNVSEVAPPVLGNSDVDWQRWPVEAYLAALDGNGNGHSGPAGAEAPPAEARNASGGGGT